MNKVADENLNILSILDFSQDDIDIDENQIISSIDSKRKKSKFNDRNKARIFNLKLIFHNIDHKFNSLIKLHLVIFKFFTS